MTKNQIDALYRCALAEHFTSPSTRATYDVHAMLQLLSGAKLVRRTESGMFRLTDHGRAAMEHELDAERAEVLAKMRERRAKIRSAL